MNREQQLKQVIEEYLKASPEIQANVDKNILKQVVDEYQSIKNPSNLIDPIAYRQEESVTKSTPQSTPTRRFRKSAKPAPVKDPVQRGYNENGELGVLDENGVVEVPKSETPEKRPFFTPYDNNSPSIPTPFSKKHARDQMNLYDSFALDVMEEEANRRRLRAIENEKNNKLSWQEKLAFAADDVLVPVVDSFTSLGRMVQEGANNIYGYATGKDMSEANKKLYENAETFRKDGIFGGFYPDAVRDRYDNSKLGKTTKSVGNLIQGVAEYSNPILLGQNIAGAAGSLAGHLTDNEALKHLGNLNGQARTNSWLKGYEGAIPAAYNIAKAGLKTAAQSAAREGDDIIAQFNKLSNNRLKYNDALRRAANNPLVGSNTTPAYMNNPMNRGGEKFAKEMGKFFDNPRLETSKVPLQKIIDNANKGASPQALQRQLNADLRQKAFPHSF